MIIHNELVAKREQLDKAVAAELEHSNHLVIASHVDLEQNNKYGLKNRPSSSYLG